MTTNPLVAAPVDMSSPLGGTMLLESLADLTTALESGSWLEIGLAAFSTAMDTIAAVSDPLGQLIAAGLGWLMEHMEPLKGWLNDLTGDAGAVAGFATTWDNIATQMTAAGDELERLVRADLEDMTGAGIAAYTLYATDFAGYLRGLSGSSASVGSSLRTCSMIVKVVHDLVRDALAELVGAAISYVVELVATVGLATPVVIEQVTTRIAALATKVGTKVTGVIKSASSLKKLIEALKEAIESIARKLRGSEPRGRGALFGEGSRNGVDPTDVSIREGSVRMEAHPGYPATIQRLKDRGFEVVEQTKGDPHVEIRRILSEDSTIVRTERQVVVNPGMRYLDLEHEVGHVDQMLDPTRFPDGPPPTSIQVELPNGKLKQAPDQKGVLTAWQNPVVEYHNRLTEVLRLKANGASEQILEEHMSGVKEWKDAYWKKGLKSGYSTSQQNWANEHFPDIGALARQVTDELGHLQ